MPKIQDLAKTVEVDNAVLLSQLLTLDSTGVSHRKLNRTVESSLVEGSVETDIAHDILSETTRGSKLLSQPVNVERHTLIHIAAINYSVSCLKYMLLFSDLAINAQG